MKNYLLSKCWHFSCSLWKQWNIHSPKTKKHSQRKSLFLPLNNCFKKKKKKTPSTIMAATGLEFYVTKVALVLSAQYAQITAETNAITAETPASKRKRTLLMEWSERVIQSKLNKSEWTGSHSMASVPVLSWNLFPLTEVHRRCYNPCWGESLYKISRQYIK